MMGPLWGKSLPTASNVKQKKTKKYDLWEFPGIQWLGLRAFTAKGSLVGEIRSHKPCGTVRKKKKSSNLTCRYFPKRNENVSTHRFVYEKFTTALFIIAKKKKKKEETSQCQSTGEELNFSIVTVNKH